MSTFNFNRIEGGSHAFGDHSTVANYHGDRGALRRAAGTLLREVQAAGSRLAEPDRVCTAAAAIQAEAATTQPSVDQLQRLLDSVTAGAAGFTSVLDAAADVSDLITTIS